MTIKYTSRKFTITFNYTLNYLEYNYDATMVKVEFIKKNTLNK